MTSPGLLRTSDSGSDVRALLMRVSFIGIARMRSPYEALAMGTRVWREASGLAECTCKSGPRQSER